MLNNKKIIDDIPYIPMVSLDLKPKCKIKFSIISFDVCISKFFKDNDLHFEEGESYPLEVINKNIDDADYRKKLNIINEKLSVTDIFVNIDEIDKFKSLMNIVKTEQSNGKYYAYWSKKWIHNKG